jgi:expansin (peptidoglycan-binding protein)
VRRAAGFIIGFGIFAGSPACSSDGGPRETPDAAKATGGAVSNATGGAVSNATGGAPSQGGGTASGGASAPCSAEQQRSGEATYYTFADGAGNCSFDPTPDDLMVGAMNATDYEASGACGACATLQGPSGTVSIRIVDQCPECKKGDIDLSPEAFDRIAARNLGRVPITWKYVPCALASPMSYRFKEGSSQWWTAVQVRHHLNRIAKFEYQKAGTFVEVPRENYNYFVEGSGMGTGPYTFRVTDVYGSVVIDSGIAFKEAQEVPGKAQLPACAE